METGFAPFERKMDELVRAIEEGVANVCKVIKENPVVIQQKLYGNQMANVAPMPDITNYGEWEVNSVSGMWGTSSHWKKIGFLGYVNNYDPVAMCKTSIYHEFMKWLLKNPRNGKQCRILSERAAVQND